MRAPVASPEATGAQPVPVVINVQSPPEQVPNRQRPTQRKGKSSKKLLVTGIIACAVAILLLIATLLIQYFKPFDLFKEKEVSPPDISQVVSGFNGANIPTPNIQNFEYVDTKDLKGPEVENITIGDVTQSEGERGKDIYCNAAGTAVFSNASIKVQVPVTLRMNYDADSEGWSPGEVSQTSTTPSATPAGPPDAKLLEAELPNRLANYDPEIAKQFEGCAISSQPSLTVEGGTIVYQLSKDVEDSEEKLQCTVNESVKWDDKTGWKPSIDSIEGLPDSEGDGAANQIPDAQAPVDNPAAGESGSGSSGSSGGGGSSGSSGQQPTKLLVCYTGELVEIPGTVQFGTNKVLIRSDEVIQVVLDGRTFITQYFELIPGEGSLTAGEHRYFIGEISATGTSDTPLVINENWDW